MSPYYRQSMWYKVSAEKESRFISFVQFQPANIGASVYLNATRHHFSKEFSSHSLLE